ncbi:MAG: MFS transporter [Spirochaetales bacterium]|nr:MFS transporter [Spirochaetales bacterium]
MDSINTPRPLLYATSFAANLAIGLLGFGLLFYLSDSFGVSPSRIGWINGVWALAYLLGCLGTKGVISRFPPPLMLSTASMFMALSALGIFVSGSSWFITGAYIFFGFSTSLFWPPLMGWLSRGLEGKDLGAALSRFNLSWSSGSALSPYAGGLLLLLGGRAPLITVVSLCALLVLVFTGYRAHSAGRKTADDPRPHEGGTPLSETAGLAPGLPRHGSSDPGTLPSTPSAGLAKPGLTYAGWIGVFCAYVFTGALLYIFPLYARTRLSLSEPVIGVLLLIKSSATLLGFQYLKQTSWWHFRSRQMIAGQLLLAVCGFLFTAVTGILSAASAMALFGFIFALLYTNSIFHGASGSGNREDRMAIHESVLTAGLIAGSAGGGFLYQTCSMDSAFLFCAAWAVIGLFCQLFLLSKKSAKSG